MCVCVMCVLCVCVCVCVCVNVRFVNMYCACYETIFVFCEI